MENQMKPVFYGKHPLLAKNSKQKEVPKKQDSGKDDLIIPAKTAADVG